LFVLNSWDIGRLSLGKIGFKIFHVWAHIRSEFISIPPSHLPFHIESSKALHYGYGGQIEGLKNPDVPGK
jgi:hypothetical protein